MNVHTQSMRETMRVVIPLSNTASVFASRLPPWLGLLMALALALSACSKQQAGNPQLPAAEVGFITVQSQPVVLQSELAGRTAPSLMSDVRPQVSGIIESRKFEEGSQVDRKSVV